MMKIDEIPGKAHALAVFFCLVHDRRRDRAILFEELLDMMENPNLAGQLAHMLDSLDEPDGEPVRKDFLLTR